VRKKTISRHYRRRRADEQEEFLTILLKRTLQSVGQDGIWSASASGKKLIEYGVPTWTRRIVVRPARLRFHYRVEARER
jgi:hypothetical protein